MSIDHFVVDEDEVVRGILDWVRIESPTYNKNAVNRMMDLAEHTMECIGAEIYRKKGVDGYGDVLKARIGSNSYSSQPGILILGHLDTIHLEGTINSDLKVRREGDKLFGPGVSDMKGGMYLACHVVEQLLKDGNMFDGPISFMFIPDEEVGSPSTRGLIEEEARNHKYVLVPEPAKPRKFISGRHAFLRYKIHVYGKPAHAGIAVGVGHSAISVMSRTISDIESFSKVEDEITYRVGNVSGGNFVNVVPTECHAEVLCVAPTDEAMKEIVKNMMSIAREDENIIVEVEPGPVRPLFQPSTQSMPLINEAIKIASELGLELGHGQFGGGSDGNFTGAMGIPTLDGLGVEGDGHHTKQEHLLVSSLVPRAKLFAGIIKFLSSRVK